LKQGRRKQNPAGTVQVKATALMYATLVHTQLRMYKSGFTGKGDVGQGTMVIQ